MLSAYPMQKFTTPPPASIDLLCKFDDGKVQRLYFMYVTTEEGKKYVPMTRDGKRLKSNTKLVSWCKLPDDLLNQFNIN